MREVTETQSTVSISQHVSIFFRHWTATNRKEPPHPDPARAPQPNDHQTKTPKHKKAIKKK